MVTSTSAFLRASAIAAMHAIYRRVQVFFPTSTYNTVSQEVILQSSAMPGLLDDQFAVYFPMKFRSDIWHQGIVPVILNPGFGPLNPLIQGYVQVRDWESYLKLLEAEIQMVLGQKGFIPWDEPTEEPSNPAAGKGEPVSRVTPVIPTYRKYDCDC